MHKDTILIIDDDIAILEATKLLLEDAGYQVQTNTGNVNIANWKNYPDLILLDIWMSGVDGSSICKKLKYHSKTKQIPVILLSANNNVAKIAKKVEADDFIAKPFAMEELLKKIKKLLK